MGEENQSNMLQSCYIFMLNVLIVIFPQDKEIEQPFGISILNTLNIK